MCLGQNDYVDLKYALRNMSKIDIIKQIEEKRNIYNENNRNWYHQRKLEGRNIKIKKPEEKMKPGPKPNSLKL